LTGIIIIDRQMFAAANVLGCKAVENTWQ